jgi:hypothetical protein
MWPFDIFNEGFGRLQEVSIILSKPTSRYHVATFIHTKLQLGSSQFSDFTSKAS